MKKQALILGLGQLGLSLVRSMSEKGIDVLAVDKDQDRVQKIASLSVESVCFDTTNESALSRTAPEKRDFCVVAIGDEARDASIVTTALLRQLGARMIIARANDDIHERILRLVGAHEVVNPERAFGERLASRLAYSGVLDQVPLGEDLLFSEVAVPEKAIGRNLVDIALPRRFGVTVVGARRRDEQGRGRIHRLTSTEPLKRDDILLVVAPPEGLSKMTEEL